MEEEREYTVGEILQILMKRIWLIIGIAAVTTILAAVVSIFVMNPVYQSTTEIIVKQEVGQEQMINQSEIRSNLDLVTTYSGIIQSPAILDQVRGNLNLENLGTIQVRSENNSQIISIVVNAPNATQAAMVANEIAGVFQEEIIEIMNVNSVYILSEADVNQTPVEPNPVTNTAIGLIVGLMIGIAVAFLIDYFDNTIKSEEDIDQIAESSFIGTISTIFDSSTGEVVSLKRQRKKSAKKNKRPALRGQVRSLITHTQPDSVYAEEFRNIRTTIELTEFDTDLRSLLVTSSGPSEGKSTITANLAIAFAQHGKKVLLVDTDLRKPTVHYTFQLDNSRGLSNVLSEQSSIYNAIAETGEPGLHIMTSGPIPPNPSKMMGSKNMEKFINEAYELYDIVLFDTPPILPVADARILMKNTSGVVLVTRNALTEKKTAQKAVESIRQSKGNLLGIILNDKTQSEDNYYATYSYKADNRMPEAK